MGLHTCCWHAADWLYQSRSRNMMKSKGAPQESTNQGEGLCVVPCTFQTAWCVRASSIASRASSHVTIPICILKRLLLKAVPSPLIRSSSAAHELSLSDDPGAQGSSWQQDIVWQDIVWRCEDDAHIPVSPLDLGLHLLRKLLQEPKFPEADESPQWRHNAQDEDCEPHLCMP